MLVLDTNHFSELDRATNAGAVLREQLQGAEEAKAVTVVTAEEVMRGWLAHVHAHRDGSQAVEAYRRFQAGLLALGKWNVLPWTNAAAERFRDLRVLRTRIGPMDLRIACIALAHGATLLTRNVADFQQVPGLRVENWLD